MTCTLGEVKNRADFIVYWGGNPAECHPRHFTKYALTPKGKFVPNGRKDRTMVLVDIRETPSVKAADVFLQVRPTKDFELITALRALVKGQPVDPAVVAETWLTMEQVRDFAERLITDHTRLQDQWSQLASRNGMPSKPGMGPRHREKITQLQKVSGKNFDKAYMVLMIQQHQDEVSYWQNEGRDSQSSEVRRLVDAGLPTLEQHLSQAKQVGRQVGVNPDQALRNRTDIARDKSNKNKDKDQD